MKKYLLAAAAIVALAAPAAAADLAARPVYTKAPIVAAPVYSWKGFYAGVNAGGVWSNADTRLTASTFFTSFALIGADGSVGLDKSGFTGGVQAGYNWQFGQFVLGVEADINSTNISNSKLMTRGAVPGLSLGYTIGESISSDWLVTLRARAGYAANSWLFYVTAGLAIADFDFTQGSFFPNCPCGIVGSDSGSKTGWTVGAGVEYAAWTNWTVKAEYLYVDLGRESFADNLGAFGFPTAAFTHSARLQENIFRVGLNYRFGGL